MGERRRLLLTMLDAVCVDTLEEKSVVAIRPKPAFIPLSDVATTKEGSGVMLISEKDLPPVDEDQEADTSPCLWWRRGRVECSQFATDCVYSFTEWPFSDLRMGLSSEPINRLGHLH